MNLGELIKHYRQTLSLSQPELAVQAGIEQSYLSKIENNKSIPSNEILRKLLSALGISLDVLLNKLSSSSVEQLSSLPDVEQWLAQSSKTQFNQRRNYLICSSAIVCLAVTLFFTGYSKLIYSERLYIYKSDGVVLPGEVKNIFSEWRWLIASGPNKAAEREAKDMEMRKRRDEQTLRFDTWQGDAIVKEIGNGKRYYFQYKQIMEPRPINAWLQVFAVLLLSIGVMGFYLERKLFK